jgi:fibrillarin-like rRNA methylase
MKQITLRFENVEGDIINEKIISISENDKLVFKPNQSIPTATLVDMFDRMSKALESNTRILYIPEYMDLKVLRINKCQNGDGNASCKCK